MNKELEIRGEKWLFYWFSDEDWVHHGEMDARAITLDEEREVYFKLSEVTREIIIHELFHVLNAGLYLYGADLTPHQTEEVQASFFEHHLDLYLSLIDKLMSFTLEAKQCQE